jgi:hypothetical protein
LKFPRIQKPIIDLPLTHDREEVARLGSSRMRKLRMRAAELYRQQLGDQASFFLKASE